jgi:hypothetical protein
VRHDPWTPRDRLLAAAFAVYGLVGVANNYARVSPRVAEGARGAIVIVGIVTVGLAFLFFATEVVRRKRPVETLGFKVGTWPSSTLTVVAGACVAASLNTVPLTSARAAGIALPFLAVLVEEILFRPVLISCLHGWLTPTRTSRTLAVVSSAALWTVLHVPSKSPSMLVGLFITGILVGALYVWSGTNIVGYVLHALANSGSGGAAIMFALCLVLGVVARLADRRTGRNPTSGFEPVKESDRFEVH